VGRAGDDLTNSLSLPRNFSVSTAERVRALIGGPPAYALRRRRIEDLEAWIVRSIREYEAKGSRVDLASPPAPLGRAMATLVRLVESHNRYYPIEASLPIDVATGELVELGKRWRPMPVPTVAELVGRARR
jgi:hypothetical protein